MRVAVVGSPPYAESLHLNESVEADIARMVRNGVAVTGGAQSRTPVAAHHANQGYGLTHGQLGALPSGTLDAPPQPTSPVPVTTWQGCYGDSWQDLIVPEAFAHPAKFARGLIHRIYRHLIAQGYVRQGTVVLDPFGGVALGALDAMTYGLRYVGVELEPRFVALGQQNLDLWRQRYGFAGGTIVQGDSRYLRQVLAGAQVGCVVGSPPFSHSEGNKAPHKFRDPDAFAAEMARRTGRSKEAHLRDIHRYPRDAYGTTPGQLGAMPPGALVSSPPYAGAGEVLGTHNGIDWSKAQEGGKVATPARQASGEGYGMAPGQMGRMPPGAVVSSPPYVGSVHDGNGIDASKLTGNRPGMHTQAAAEGYGTSAGQLGAMPPGVVVSSPPYEGSISSERNGIDWSKMHHGSVERKHGHNPHSAHASGLMAYGTSPAQLGNSAGDTFWSASAQIMAELAALLPPGAVCAWVLKAYVSKGRIVPFPDQWRALCEQHGFETREIIHASLIEHCGIQEGLFGKAEVVQTARKSFFRRLAERRGSPCIDHETILILSRE